MATLDAETRARMQAALDESGPLLSFGEAIVLHLTGPHADESQRPDVVERVLSLLGAIQAGEEPAAELLVKDPPLLASFFQNADLLTPGSPEARAIGRLVMRALELVDDHG